MEATPSEQLLVEDGRRRQKRSGRRSAGSAAYAMQRRDADGYLFCHRSNGRARAESSREGRLVQREQKSMAERKGVRECVEALNIERRELEKERERLCQVHHQPATHCCSLAAP
jgi:hypothetical protein